MVGPIGYKLISRSWHARPHEHVILAWVASACAWKPDYERGGSACRCQAAGRSLRVDSSFQRVRPSVAIWSSSNHDVVRVKQNWEYPHPCILKSLPLLHKTDSSLRWISQNHFHIQEALLTDGSKEQKYFLFFNEAPASRSFSHALSRRGTGTVSHYKPHISARATNIALTE
jgi:hypothetical protein